MEDTIREVFDFYNIYIDSADWKSFLFLCPFHEQGEHSFNARIYFDNGGWECFNPLCGSSGFLTTIIQRLEPCNYRKACKILSDEFNFKVEETEFLERRRLKNKNEKIFSKPKFYDRLSPDNPYLQKHSFTWGNLTRLNVGESKQDPKTLVLLYTWQSDICGYAVKSKKGLRYPSGFSCNNYLYCFDQGSLWDNIVVCEGQRDVWRMWEIGVPAVGINGSKISKKQRNLLIKTWKHVTILLDGDIAGVAGTLKILQSLQGLISCDYKLVKWATDPENLREKTQYDELKSYTDMPRLESILERRS